MAWAEKAAVSNANVTLSRDMLVRQPHLHLPVRHGADKHIMRLMVDGRTVRQFEIGLAEGAPDFWMDTDIAPYLGKTLRIEVDHMRAGSPVLASIKQADHWPGGDRLYHEPLRPQFHFSPARGWTNDPNGLVYDHGEYHLFFQHNPYGTQWGNMTWGHAVSTDLIHWSQLPDALQPDQLGTMFSGSAVVDQQNTTGWQQGEQPPMVCIYTSAGGTSAESKGQPFSQSVAYSTDRGRSWRKFAGNPVLDHIHGHNRDPKVFWHQPTRQWVMILYLEPRDRFALFGGPDLQHWRKLSDLPLPGGHECPDMFPLPIDGDPANRRWVVWEAGGLYLIGQFDGTTFTPESGPFPSKFGENDYAAQTYSNIPAADGRRIQISWMRGGKYPKMPFNQQLSVPRVLSLRTTPEGVRLFFEPVEELKQLRGNHVRRQGVALDGQQSCPIGLSGPLLDVEASFDPGQAQAVGIAVCGHQVEYSSADRQLTALGKSAPLRPIDGRIQLRILVDRTSIEVFANRGRVQMASCFLPDADHRGLAVYASGGHAIATQVDAWELRSAWHRTSSPAHLKSPR